MSDKNQLYNREVIKDGVIVLLAIFIMTLFSSLPMLTILIYYIWPIPLVYFIVKHDINKAFFIIVITALIYGLLWDMALAIYAILGFGLIGFILGAAVKENFSPLRTLIITIAAVILSDFLLLWIAPGVLNVNFNELSQEIIEGLAAQPELGEFSVLIEQQLALIEVLYPSMMVITSIISGILIYYLALWFLNRMGLKKEAYKPLREWQFPPWALTVGLIISILFRGNLFFANTLVVIIFLFFLQGFAVGLYYIHKKGSALLSII